MNLAKRVQAMVVEAGFGAEQRRDLNLYVLGAVECQIELGEPLTCDWYLDATARGIVAVKGWWGGESQLMNNVARRR